jgi:hypothetical protein
MTHEDMEAFDERLFAVWLASLDRHARAQYTKALALYSSRGRSASVDTLSRVIVKVTWEAHAVRHRLGAQDALRWGIALLTQERQGRASLCLYASPGDDETFRFWEETMPLSDYGTCQLTTEAVLDLASQYHVSARSKKAPFFCDECICSCGRQVEEPLAFYCGPCRFAQDIELR